MKFVIENLSKTSGRLGYLVQNETGKQFKTPLLLQTTKGGSIPYLSREVFDLLTTQPQTLQLSLATMDHMQEALMHCNGIIDIASYLGYKDYPTVLMIRDPCVQMPSGFNDRDVAPYFTRRGKEFLSPNKFMELVKVYKPDIYQGLCDADTNWESSKKRIQKSVDRTKYFMNVCYDYCAQATELKSHCMFAPIVGGFNTYNRSQSIKHAKSKGCDIIGGYVFEGFHNYGLTATEVTKEQLLPVMQHCMNELLAIDKPIMLPGAYTPSLVLELIRLGVDIFDSSYAYCATVNFKALSFGFNEKSINAVGTPFIDVTDECFKEDFTPLLQHCECLACRKHTRGYIHHLYKTSELLGPILLMIHNLHHLMGFFSAIHDAITADTLSELIHMLQYQGGHKQVEYRITANTKVISRAGVGKGFAKPKE